MWRKFKWDMFVTSFIPLWVSISVIDVWDIIMFTKSTWNNQNKFSENLLSVLDISKIQLISVFVIFLIVICSIAGINSFLKRFNNATDMYKGKVIKATKANKLSSEFLLAYILPMIAFDFGTMKNIALFLIYFSFLAYLCIRNNNIYTNILLEFKGYCMYTCDLECPVLEEKHIYHDSLIISKCDLTQKEGDNVDYWDFDNYIYIIPDGGRK